MFFILELLDPTDQKLLRKNLNFLFVFSGIFILLSRESGQSALTSSPRGNRGAVAMGGTIGGQAPLEFILALKKIRKPNGLAYIFFQDSCFNRC